MHGILISLRGTYQRDRCRIDVVIASQSCDNRSMARIPVTYLLLFAIVVCPFNCMGFFHHDRSFGETAKSCACCMECQALEPSDDCSNERDGKDDRPNSGHSSCICDGVMLSQLDSSDIELTDSDFNWDLLVYCFADLKIVAVQHNWIFEEQTRPFIVSGSFVRISHRSLLI